MDNVKGVDARKTIYARRKNRMKRGWKQGVRMFIYVSVYDDYLFRWNIISITALIWF